MDDLGLVKTIDRFGDGDARPTVDMVVMPPQQEIGVEEVILYTGGDSEVAREFCP
ncbi:hypothetical protein D3C85_1814700 [compost metagenome]